MKRTTFALQVLEFADASGRTQALRTTPEHPFWTVNHHKFRSAGRLQPGDTFISPGGQFQTLTATESESHPDGIFVYNFTVEIAHTYFVSATKDDQPLLVHNADCANGGAEAGSRPPNLSPQNARRRGAFNQAKRDSGIPTSQQPARVLPNLDRRGNVQPGRVYEFDVPVPGGGKRTIRIRDDAAGHNFGPGNRQNRGPHFNDLVGGHYDY